MAPIDAYNYINTVFDTFHDVEVVYKKYEEKFFGNFVIGFRSKVSEQSIICDRGQILLCDGLSTESSCRLIVEDIYSVEEDTLLGILQHVVNG